MAASYQSGTYRTKFADGTTVDFVLSSDVDIDAMFTTLRATIKRLATIFWLNPTGRGQR